MGDENEGTGADPWHSYSHGTYGEMVTLRAIDLPRDLSPDTDDAFVLAAFLLGLYVGRRRIFHNVPAHRALLRRVQKWGLLIGIAANAAFAIGGALDPAPGSVVQNVGRVCLVIGAPALALFYASTIVLLTQTETWRRRLAPLAAVGRMALSNYLLQSVICTTIFYGYGLGLFGRVGPAAGLGLTLAIYATQIPLSLWWLRRFRLGPVGWIWGWLALRKLPPIRPPAS